MHPDSPSTLLIADDDPVVRSMLSMALERRFEVVAVAGDGEAAVAKAAETHPDVALVDVQMPGGGAPRAVAGIAETSPSTAVVVLSMDESEASVLDLIQAGATTYVRKGIAIDELIVTLEKAFHAHRHWIAAGLR